MPPPGIWRARARETVRGGRRSGGHEAGHAYGSGEQARELGRIMAQS